MSIPDARALLDALPWQVATVDPQGVIQQTNRAWRDVNRDRGVEHDDVGTDYFAWCATLPGGHETIDHVRSVLLGRSDRIEIEYPAHSADTARWFVMTITPVHDGDHVVAALLSHREITAQRQHERDLRTFVSLAAHDLHSPLRHMASFPELLESDLGPQLDEQPRRWLSAIRQASTTMRSRLDNLVALARSHVDPLRFTVLDVVELVRERFTLLCEARSVDARLEVTGDPELVSDEKLFRVLVDNALTSALKHGRGTKALLVSVSCERREPGFVVRFDDNGPGFAEVNPSKLLQPFDPSRKRAQGFGLGLSIVKQVADRLAATLTLGTADLGGARIEVGLPERAVGSREAREEGSVLTRPRRPHLD